MRIRKTKKRDCQITRIRQFSECIRKRIYSSVSLLTPCSDYSCVLFLDIIMDSGPKFGDAPEIDGGTDHKR